MPKQKTQQTSEKLVNRRKKEIRERKSSKKFVFNFQNPENPLFFRSFHKSATFQQKSGSQTRRLAAEGIAEGHMSSLSATPNKKPQTGHFPLKKTSKHMSTAHSKFLPR